MAGTVAPVGSGGNRLSWAATPKRVRRAIEERLGSTVVMAQTQAGGFSPGLAARLLLADGRRFFAKAVAAERNPLSPEMFRREARISEALPEAAPVPRLLWTYDDGDWVALLFSDIEGRTPAEPWLRAELDRVLGALPRLWELLTPSPVAAPTVFENWGEDFGEWRRLAGRSGAASSLAAADSWAARNLDKLAELADRWPTSLHGETLIHGDLRADNILLTSEGGVVFVDWPGALIGPPWVDLVFMLPSVAMHGIDPEEVFLSSAVGRVADADLVTSLLAGVCAYFIPRSLLPAPPGLPTIREFQRAQGRAALGWLRRRLR